MTRAECGGPVVSLERVASISGVSIWGERGRLLLLCCSCLALHSSAVQRGRLLSLALHSSAAQQHAGDCRLLLLCSARQLVVGAVVYLLA